MESPFFDNNELQKVHSKPTEGKYHSSFSIIKSWPCFILILEDICPFYLVTTGF